MQLNFSVFREGDSMAAGLQELKEIRERLQHARLDDKSSDFNTQRIECLELDNLMETAYSTAVAANSVPKAVVHTLALTSQIVMTKTGYVTHYLIR